MMHELYPHGHVAHLISANGRWLSDTLEGTFRDRIDDIDTEYLKGRDLPRITYLGMLSTIFCEDDNPETGRMIWRAHQFALQTLDTVETDYSKETIIDTAKQEMGHTDIDMIVGNTVRYLGQHPTLTTYIESFLDVIGPHMAYQTEAKLIAGFHFMMADKLSHNDYVEAEVSKGQRTLEHFHTIADLG